MIKIKFKDENALIQIWMGAKIIYKKILMQEIQTSSSCLLLQHQQSIKTNLPQVIDIKSFLKCIHECLKIVVEKSVNNSDQLSQLTMLEKNYYVSNLSQEVFLNQDVVDIKMFIRQKHGYIFCLIAEFITRLLILNSVLTKNRDSIKPKTNQYRDGIVNNLQKLRFQMQIENINRISEGKNLLQYQQIIQYTIDVISTKSINQQTICVIYEAMKQQNANIPQSFQQSVYNIIKRSQNLKKGQILKINQQKIHKQKDLVLKIIKKKEQEFKLKRKQNDQQQKKPQNKNIFSLAQANLYKKGKFINKTRTIYHQRKNLYIPRKKRQQYNVQRSQKSIDKSTQWSFTYERFKKSTARDINQDFQDDFLVGKTPKPQRLLSFRDPISFRLDFSN